VRASGAGGGSAILAGPDGRQVSVGVGEEIAPGVTLVSVAADHAVIERGGARERLEFAAATQGAPSSPPSGAGGGGSLTGGAVSSAAPLIGSIGLQPRRVDGRVSGFVLIPRGDTAG